jgi:hypothetical protein
MRKIFAVAMVFLFCLVTVVAAQQGPAKVTINAAAKKQAAVVFDHAAHVKRAPKCDACHHTNKGMTTDKGAKVEKCSSCHLDPKDAKVPGMREMTMTKNPFHMVCVNCHKTAKKGPVVCTGCHKK